MSADAVAAGLHESLLTLGLQEQLKGSPLLPTFAEVDEADQPHVLARHLAEALVRRLPRNAEERVRLVNDLLLALEESESQPIAPVRQLLRLAPEPGPGVTPITTERPGTPLSEVALLTNAPGEPSLGHELAAEIRSADEIDLLCAFVQWHGLRCLEDELADAHDRGVPIRVVTTTYIGGTERRALDRLIKDFGAEVRVQYDARLSRLHAKAWLFRRRTGFHTGYVGSSNLSNAALVTGQEWNVRLSAITTSHLLDKFSATFDSYWNSDSFGPYRGADTEDAALLDRALSEARGGRAGAGETVLSGLEVRPYPYQADILDRVRAEREVHDLHRNLIVAATGTGKTVMAALDYAALCSDGKQPSLLFVAHRHEILDQARRKYREVLNDGVFGEMYVNSEKPEKWRHVFASIQSLTSYGIDSIDPTAFDVVVVDEFHHAEAATYRRMLGRLQPQELLGMTATPERGDGTDVRAFFNGRVAAELRVWDAIAAGLLCPFHYFGVNDETNLQALHWTQGRYAIEDLDNLYTGNDARARLVMRQVRDKILDPQLMKAIGFCVSVKHAHFMADFFTQHGLPSVALSGHSTTAERELAIAHLKAGEIQAIFTVDLFNEGVDIPQVDTILMLRPTESPTIFLQQLGRGLRLYRSKDVLTVLDFIGQHRKEYRLDLRYRALTGRRGPELQHQVEQGFPLLPSGCQIVLDRVAQEAVLENLKANLQPRWPSLVNALRAEPTDDLATFLQREQIDLPQVIRSTRGRTWTQLRADAGLEPMPTPQQEKLLRRVRALTHVDDPVRARGYRRVLDGQDVEEGVAGMFFWSLWPDGGGFASPEEGLASLSQHPGLCQELRQVIDLSFLNTRRLTVAQGGPLAQLPLRPHASYTREEILAGLGCTAKGRVPTNFREGVLFTHVDDIPVDAFFITLKKSEAEYSPSTLYRDYPISRELFHWESQSTTSVNSPTGQRYLTGGSVPLLFVRQQRDGDFGTAPFVFLGDASYVSHTGDRPIAITWRLRTPMPADLFAASTVTG